MKRFTSSGGWWVVGQGLLLGACLGSWVSWHAFWGPWPLGLGLLLALLGGVAGIWGGMALGDNLTPYPSPVPGATLVEGGPYRLVRHPIYGGVVLGCLGISLAVGSAPGLVLSLISGPYYLLKARFEESRLHAHFPQYAEYEKRVRHRLLPWVV